MTNKPRLPLRYRAYMTAKVKLRPNGDHQLDMDLGLAGFLHLQAGDVARLRRALDDFETEVRIDDGHNTRINTAVKALGEY